MSITSFAINLNNKHIQVCKLLEWKKETVIGTNLHVPVINGVGFAYVIQTGILIIAQIKNTFVTYLKTL